MTHDETLRRAAELLRNPAPRDQASAEWFDQNGTADALDTLRDELDTVSSAAHRLALDLECLLLSSDNPAATKWWSESCATLQSWRELVDLTKGIQNDPR